MTYAFDCDGTLIDILEDKPRPEIVALAHCLVYGKHEVIVWSGGGESYARNVAARCGLVGVTVKAKPVGSGIAGIVDVAFDDMNVVYGKLNIKV